VAVVLVVLVAALAARALHGSTWIASAIGASRREVAGEVAADAL
jgi:hypothetical protein